MSTILGIVGFVIGWIVGPKIGNAMTFLPGGSMNPIVARIFIAFVFAATFAGGGSAVSSN